MLHVAGSRCADRQDSLSPNDPRRGATGAWDVRLTESELLLIGIVAAQRHAQDLALQRSERYGATGNSLDAGYVGCFGELAVAKVFNRFWSGAVGDLKAKDVGTLQVRASRHSNPSLILHEQDADEDRFFCVSCLGRLARIHGWMFAHEGKLPEFWRTDTNRPAYFVPCNRLRRMPERAA